MAHSIRLPLLLLCSFVSVTEAQGIRERMRPKQESVDKRVDTAQAPQGLKGESVLTQSQAADITLTLTKAGIRPIQTWVRAAGHLDPKDGSHRKLIAKVQGVDAHLIKLGQRVRAFSLLSRSSMIQGKVTRIAAQDNHAQVEVTLAASSIANSPHLVEIIVERGDFFSLPNEALINEGDRQIVYVQRQPGHYVPQEVHAMLQGERYTEVHGLEEGDEVVTIGSFFVDADYKLKHTGLASQGAHERHHH